VELIHQAVDAVCGVAFGDLGKACIACGGGGAGMAEEALDMSQA